MDKGILNALFSEMVNQMLSTNYMGIQWAMLKIIVHADFVHTILLRFLHERIYILQIYRAQAGYVWGYKMWYAF